MSKNPENEHEIVLCGDKAVVVIGLPDGSKKYVVAPQDEAVKLESVPSVTIYMPGSRHKVKGITNGLLD